MRPQPTLGDIELEYHNSKTTTDSIVGTLLREYKSTVLRLNQELQLKVMELSKMREKYEPKKDKKN